MPLFSALRRGKKSIGYDTHGGVRNQPLSGQTFTHKIQIGRERAFHLHKLAYPDLSK